ncbi:UNVERIFIED_CONTAM: Ube2e2 [Trichonephila clavipes]
MTEQKGITNTENKGMGDGLEDSLDGPDHMKSMKRLQKELVEITRNPPPLCTAGLKDSHLYEWTATIIGPPDSVYEGGVFTLDIKFTKHYPFKPPKIKFLTRIYHCNVSRSGYICLDILNENWTPALTVRSLLLSICSLMSDCNPGDPLVPPIATLYQTNREEHDRRAREYTLKYAFQ